MLSLQILRNQTKKEQMTMLENRKGDSEKGGNRRRKQLERREQKREAVRKEGVGRNVCNAGRQLPLTLTPKKDDLSFQIEIIRETIHIINFCQLSKLHGLKRNMEAIHPQEAIPKYQFHWNQS
jgi:hypothetical protein